MLKTVPKEEYDDLLEEFKDLESSYLKLSRGYDELQDCIRRLKEDRDRLLNKIVRLEEESSIEMRKNDNRIGYTYGG